MPFKIKQASPASRKQKEVAVDNSRRCVTTKKETEHVPSASCESRYTLNKSDFRDVVVKQTYSDVEQLYIMLKDCRACTNCTPNTPPTDMCDIWLRKYT